MKSSSQQAPQRWHSPSRSAAIEAWILMLSRELEGSGITANIVSKAQGENIQAAIGLAQCEQAAEKVARKRELAARYARLLGDPRVTGEKLPPPLTADSYLWAWKIDLLWLGDRLPREVPPRSWRT